MLNCQHVKKNMEPSCTASRRFQKLQRLCWYCARLRKVRMSNYQVRQVWALQQSKAVISLKSTDIGKQNCWSGKHNDVLSSQFVIVTDFCQHFPALYSTHLPKRGSSGGSNWPNHLMFTHHEFVRRYRTIVTCAFHWMCFSCLRCDCPLWLLVRTWKLAQCGCFLISLVCGGLGCLEVGCDNVYEVSFHQAVCISIVHSIIEKVVPPYFLIRMFALPKCILDDEV